MKGFIARTMTTVCWAAAGAAAVGCYGWTDICDPCYPQRYEFAARQEVKQAFAPQVLNGHLLDQTVWNYDFEPGTATLTPGGMEHLQYLARRRPCPDTTIYLQVAQDVPYDPNKFSEFVEGRNNLDTRRTQSIQDYLTAITTGRNLTFNILRHDPA